MPVRIVWSQLARQDLIDHYLWIGALDSQAAERIYDRLEIRVRQLADHPRLGPRRTDIRPTMRILVEPPFLILYETHPDFNEGQVREVEIVRVVYGRRNLTTLF